MPATNLGMPGTGLDISTSTRGEVMPNIVPIPQRKIHFSMSEWFGPT